VVLSSQMNDNIVALHQAQLLLGWVTVYVHVNHLRSTRRSTLGNRSFPVAASRAWNGLPASVRAATSLVSFRKELKMVLFWRSFE